MTCAEMRSILRYINLPVSGKKSVLQDRLQKMYSSVQEGLSRNKNGSKFILWSYESALISIYGGSGSRGMIRRDRKIMSEEEALDIMVDRALDLEKEKEENDFTIEELNKKCDSLKIEAQGALRHWAEEKKKRCNLENLLAQVNAKLAKAEAKLKSRNGINGKHIVNVDEKDENTTVFKFDPTKAIVHRRVL